MVPANPHLPYYETIRLGTISAETNINHRTSKNLFAHRMVLSREDAGTELIRVKFNPPHFGQSDQGNLYDAEVVFNDYQWATDMPMHTVLREGHYITGKINVSAAVEPLITYHCLEPFQGFSLKKSVAAYLLWRGLLAGNVNAVLPVLGFFAEVQGREVTPKPPGESGYGAAVGLITRWEPGATITAGNSDQIELDVGMEMTVLRIIIGDQLTAPDSTQVNVDFRFGLGDASRMNIRDGASTPEPIPGRQNFGSDVAAGDLGFPLHFDARTQIRGLLAVPTNAGASARPHLIFAGLQGPPEVAIPAYAVQMAAQKGNYDMPVPWLPGRPRVIEVYEQYFDRGL